MDSIFNNGFSFSLLSDDDSLQKIVYGASNYYSMRANSYYDIRLGNSNSVMCDAYIYIGNTLINIYKIYPNATVTVTMDKHNNKFRLLKNQDFKQGLIKVIFVPEKHTSTQYTNPTNNIKPDPDIYRWNCHNNYTDGVTPTNGNNRRCLNEAHDYNVNWRPLHGQQLKNTFVHTSNRYSKDDTIESSNVDNDNISVIYAQLFINNDFSINKHPYIENVRNDKTDPTLVPPNVVDKIKKLGRHRCPSYYNRTIMSESNMCPNDVQSDTGIKLPSYNRYTNGVFGGPSYNSWMMGTASPIHVNKNLYRENNYY